MKARTPARSAAPAPVAPVRKARAQTTAPKLARVAAAAGPRGARGAAAQARTARASKPRTARPRPLDPTLLAAEPDAVVRQATGRTWSQWFSLLDRFDVAGAGHSATVRHLADAHDCPRWWRQRIATAYAQSHGLRAHMSRGLAANTSRTLSVSVTTLYRAWQGRAPQKWLSAKFKVHRANENKSLRLDWPDSTSVEIYFWAKGERRSQVNIMHRQLADAADVAAKKKFWARALDKLQATLE
jgi:hypothetical protein